MKLENNLRRCRFDAGEMTQQELADKVGVTRQTIIAIEKGKFYPTALLAIKISRVFNKTVEDIFFINEEK